MPEALAQHSRYELAKMAWGDAWKELARNAEREIKAKQARIEELEAILARSSTSFGELDERGR